MAESTCPHCGAKTISYRHSLSAVLMQGFRKVLEVADAMGRFDIASCGLNNSERQNLSKLKYWGIITKRGDPTGHGGGWRVTVRGLAFAEGLRPMRKTAVTYRDEVVELTGDEVSIEDCTGGWKYRPDYALGAKPFLDAPKQSDIFQ